jgi:hypothetical protein
MILEYEHIEDFVEYISYNMGYLEGSRISFSTVYTPDLVHHNDELLV